MTTKEEVLEKLSLVEDPEIGINIVDLGLVYEVTINARSDGKEIVNIKMTLTTPACPLLGHILAEIQEKVKTINNIEEVNTDIVWDPPWNPEMMSERAKLAFGAI
ncbi:MAG: metal-sulfur cluster assembly factor [Candidatus Micrarchaeota archaeon]|nr:metal-sulfur cluster assembly factor [Candidatus Micrarchaeota archaeon]